MFVNDTATTEIYTRSRHDALPISDAAKASAGVSACSSCQGPRSSALRCTAAAIVNHGSSGETGASDPIVIRTPSSSIQRSEEHTSELQSRQYLVCRLLLEKKLTPS